MNHFANLTAFSMLFTSTNMALAGAMQTANEFGLSIPEEIGMVGHDDVAWMTLVKSTITIVHHLTDQIDRMAVDLIMQRIENPQRPPLQVMFKGLLVILGYIVRDTGK